MTSGRRPCTDCGRNSPQGRHASCHTLTLLRTGTARGWWKADLLRAVYPHRWAQKAPGEWPDVTPVDGAISTLRKQGHQIFSTNGYVVLRERLS